MTQTEYKIYRAKQTELGEEFQDFARDILHKHGISVSNYTSRVYQQRHGENLAGIEFKYDREYANTGNLYIEVAEKARPRPGSHAPSGIYRDCFWFVIGNYQIVFMFGVKVLRRLHEEAKAIDKYRLVTTATSQGLLLPDVIAREYAEKIFRDASGAPPEIAKKNGSTMEIVFRQGELFT